MVLAACCLLERPSDRRTLAVWNRRASGLCLPGGLVEPGETPIAALLRELQEEVGIVAVAEDFTEIYAAPHASPRARADRVHVFAATTPHRESWRPQARELGCPIAWVTRESLLAVSPFRDFYARMFERLSVIGLVPR
jgi:8-oxo-dGTP diphosphatase